MSSVFGELQVMINEKQFDFVTLSEIWLSDNKHIPDYVEIPSYNFVYKNREQKRGVGGGVISKKELNFKIRGELNRLDVTIEQLLPVIKGKKKKSSILLRKKMEWLGKIETMLSMIASKFTGTIILAGDTNNVNELCRPQKRYQEFLEKFNLVQHINLPTRKGL